MYHALWPGSTLLNSVEKVSKAIKGSLAEKCELSRFPLVETSGRPLTMDANSGNLLPSDVSDLIFVVGIVDEVLIVSAERID